MRTCSFPECAKKHFGRGLCQGHLDQQRRGRDLTALNFIRPLVPNPRDEATILVPLTQGLFALIDRSDSIVAAQHNWHIREEKRRDLRYAQTSGWTEGKKNTVLLHRLLWESWGLPPTPMIDHANRDGLDCRRENLRAASSSENACNRRKNRNNSSGATGVSWHSSQQIWQAYVTFRGSRRHLGSFEDIDQATAVAARARQELHGDFVSSEVL